VVSAPHAASTRNRPREAGKLEREWRNAADSSNA